MPASIRIDDFSEESALPSVWELRAGQVQVWKARLDGPPDRAAFFWPTLSVAEQARAEKFWLDRDRRRYIVGRGLLRRLLGDYLERAPERLEFTSNGFGKPALSLPGYGGTLEFNLSHANGLIVYALAWNRPVGIDLEQPRPDVAMLSLARRFFASAEFEALRHAAPAARPKLFFRWWVRKEALMKALGRGLSLPLLRLDVGREGNLPDPADADAPAWTIRDLTAPPGFVAAIAMQNRGQDSILR